MHGGKVYIAFGTVHSFRHLSEPWKVYPADKEGLLYQCESNVIELLVSRLRCKEVVAVSWLLGRIRSYILSCKIGRYS